jgi:hypothetical protein
VREARLVMAKRRGRRRKRRRRKRRRRGWGPWF